MAHRILACLIALVFVLSAMGTTSAAQPPQPPAPYERSGARPRLLPKSSARPAPGATGARTPTEGASIAALLAHASGVAAGGYHACVITSAGGVWCWGDNTYGQLGDGSTTSSSTPVAVSGLDSGVVTITAGGYHTCAVTNAGGVLCWGANWSGQLGDASMTNRASPVAVGGLASGAAGVAAGYQHTCAVISGGGILCWGSNGKGQLGNGTTSGSSTPVAVSELSNGASVTAGVYHTCAVTSAGGVKCWGGNTYGQLGDGMTASSSTPVAVIGLDSGVLTMAAGLYHTCAVTGPSGVLCWGGNWNGQLGDASMTNRAAPVAASGLASGTVGVAAGYGHTCALMDIAHGGGVRCWGDNGSGQLGDGTTTGSSTPVAASGLANGAADIAAGGGHTCAVTKAGGLLCWGNNTYGQLGDGMRNGISTPVVVSGLASAAGVAAGYGHTCALMDAAHGGGIWCWGDNSSGQLGAGTTTSSYTPVVVSGLGSSASAVGAGGYHTCALTSAGGVRCWGLNDTGQLGDGTTTNSKTPVAVNELGSGVVAVGAGGYHTCAVTSAGGVRCWGDNAYGQLGIDMSIGSSSTPVTVTELASGAATVAAGTYHTCAVTSAGGVRCWGDNTYGQLGIDMAIGSSNTAVTVTELASGAAAVAAGDYHTCAVMDAAHDSGVRCWGANGSGQLGDGTTIASSTPVTVSELAGSAAAVAAGSAHTCALLDGTHAGEIQCWGANGYGQLGDGTMTGRGTPADVSGLASGGVAVAAGANHTCVLMDVAHGGGVKCWGDNGYGQLGVNPGWTPVNVVGFSDVAIYDLTAVRSGQGVVLTWTSLGDTIDHYEVYRAPRPYFAVGAPGVQPLADVPPPPYGATATYTDTNAFAAPPSAYFYLVQTVDLAAQAHPAFTRAGAFGFKLVPGAP